MAREFLGCVRKKRCVFLLSIKLNDSRSVGRSAGRFVRFHAVILSPEEREEGEGIYYLVELLGKRTGPLLRAC